MEYTCTQCNIVFDSKDHKYDRKRRGIHNSFCSRDCFQTYHYNNRLCVTRQCGWCNKEVVRKLKEFKKSKSKLAFCGKSCAASYNNTKKRQSRRSKCETMLFDLLRNRFPNLSMNYSDKTLIPGYEIDITFPEIPLGIEWNGIVHYKPIYGKAKLSKNTREGCRKIETCTR